MDSQNVCMGEWESDGGNQDADRGVVHYLVRIANAPRREMRGVLFYEKNRIFVRTGKQIKQVI